MTKTPFKAPLITFEGIDGAGKSSQIEALAALFRQPPVITREPGGTTLGERLRELLLHQEMTPLTEAMLMFAARREHLERVIWPALQSGQAVLCDRFSDASHAYQCGGRGLAGAELAALENLTHADFAPTLTFLFDLPTARAAERVQQAARAKDRFEQEQSAFFERVRAAYLARAQRFGERIQIIDASADRAQIGQRIAAIVRTRFAAWLRDDAL